MLKDYYRDFGRSVWLTLTILGPQLVLTWVLLVPDQSAALAERALETKTGMRQINQLFLLSLLSACITQTYAMGLINVAVRANPFTRSVGANGTYDFSRNVQRQALVPTNFPILLGGVTWSIPLLYIFRAAINASSGDVLIDLSCSDYFWPLACYLGGDSKKLVVLALVVVWWILGSLVIRALFELEIIVAFLARTSVRRVEGLRNTSLFVLFPLSALLLGSEIGTISEGRLLKFKTPFDSVFMLMAWITICTVLLSALREWSLRRNSTGVGALVLFAVFALGAKSESSYPLRLSQAVVPKLQDRERADQKLTDELGQSLIRKFGADQTAPIFAISAQGGGIIAAYQSAIALARLQDQCREFSDHILSATGVSGGSLGLGVFFAAVDIVDRYEPSAWDQIKTCSPAPLIKHDKRHKGKGLHEALVDEYFGGDFLAPLLAGLLYHDTPMQIFVGSISYLPVIGEKIADSIWSASRDRSAFFENAISARWDITVRLIEEEYGKRSEGIENYFERSVGVAAPGEPFKYYSVVDSESGTPFVIGNRPFPVSAKSGSPIMDLRQLVDLRSMSVASAIVASARFPFITPPGIIKLDSIGEDRALRIVDGGYFDNSGASITQVITQYFKASMARPTLIPLSFAHETDKPWQWNKFADLSSVLLALVNTRSATSKYWRRQLITDLDGQRVEFILPYSKETVRLAWTLTEKTRQHIKTHTWPWSGSLDLNPKNSSNYKITKFFTAPYERP